MQNNRIVVAILFIATGLIVAFIADDLYKLTGLIPIAIGGMVYIRP